VTRAAVRLAAEAIRASERAKHVRLAVTEYTTMYYPNTIRQGLPNEHTLEAAVANAANLNEFIRSRDILDICNYSDLVNGWLGGVIRVGDGYADQKRGRLTGWSGKGDLIYGTPTYYVLEMYANAQLEKVVAHDLECGAFDAPKHVHGVPTAGLPVLDVVCGVKRGGGTLAAFIVNRALEDVDLALYVADVPAGSGGFVRVTELTGASPDVINDVFQPEAVVPKAYSLPLAGNELALKLRKHSVYLVEWPIERQPPAANPS